MSVLNGLKLSLYPDAYNTDMIMLKLDKARLEAEKKTAPAWTGAPKKAPTPDSSAATTNAAKKFAETPETGCHSSPCVIP